ncbi:hypothetical protein F5148DRAFT_26966 [Russula earlei]|uniref:Uncharacterized protein n=1 Tax=Russula earlei TaxID=71964 RepID=A0ACC0U8Q1_9AGAM|nr:hypothetical protein F5148DRAFT_26966 [Russula earlei]
MNFRGFIHSFLPCVPRSSTTIGSLIQDSLKGKICLSRVTINTLPDDVLVDIFYFYVNDWDVGTSGWHTLVHVCQRWRYVVFASPRRLNLRLSYTGKRPMSEMLDDLPVLPVMISLETHSSLIRGNITTFLNSEHRHRICGISMLPIPASDLETFVAAMQKPFPELTSLYIWVEESRVTFPPLPDSFLGGSASLLRRLVLRNCPFPGLPKLLLSANHLVILSLWNIPDFGYFSPQVLGAALSEMSRLAALRVEFKLPRYPTSRPPLPLTRSVLPSLTRLVFEGVHEYLEDLLAQIEAPLLNKLRIIFFMDPQFVIPQLHRLINFAESFKKCHTAFVYTSYDAIRFAAFRETHQFPELSFDISSISWFLFFHFHNHSGS